MRYNISKKGFTILELVLVIGIISALSALSLPAFKSFQYKAKISEAKTIIKSIETTVQSFITSGGTFDKTNCNLNVDGGDVCFLTAQTPNPNNNTWCRTTNFLGFVIEDCNSLHYRYSISVPTGVTQLQGNYAIGATSYPGKLGCPDANLDAWALAHCGRLIHTRRISDITACTSEVNSVYNNNNSVIWGCSWSGGDNF